MNDIEELLQKSPKLIMRSIIQRIATGPDMSKDISSEEARAGMHAILDGEVDPVQAAVFLIALRMKRETDEENIGILDGIRDETTTVTADVDEVLDVSDPFNGYNRTLPASPFLAPVLAACGVPAFSHGVETMGPKFGITHHRVLKAAGIPVDLSLDEASGRLSDDSIGWSYVDQASYCPKLHNLTGLRSNIIKRQAITTVEVMAGPIRGKNKTNLMTGYVHTPYTRVYSMLARHADFDSCLLIRGVEGGVIPSLRQKGRMFFYHDKAEEQSQEFTPEEIGIKQDVRATPLPDSIPSIEERDDVGAAFDVDVASRLAAEAGVDALSGNQTSTYDALVYAASIALWHLKKHETIQEAAQHVRKALDNGDALNRFNAAKK